jgi:hypothetical protein
MKYATRRLLAVGAILAVSVVALFGGVGVAQAKNGSNNGATVIPFIGGCNIIFNKGHDFSPFVGCD